MEGNICKCGYVFGKHIRNTTLNHLKGLRHIMYMNGATADHYKTYISAQGLLREMQREIKEQGWRSQLDLLQH